MKFPLLLAAALLLSAAIANAADQPGPPVADRLDEQPTVSETKEGTEPAPDAEPREKVATLLVFGRDACPAGEGDEILVCARLPENERYRIPKSLRGKKQPDAVASSWSARVQSLERVSRNGRPNSCSPVGSFGQTGCYRQFLEQAREERELERRERADIP